MKKANTQNKEDNNMTNATVDTSKQKGFKHWCKKHKKGLIITGIVIGTAGFGFLVWRNWDTIIDALFPNEDIPDMPLEIKEEEIKVFISEPKEMISSEAVSAVESEVQEIAKRKIPEVAFDVSGGLMKLADGKHATERAIENALNAGIEEIPDGMTYRMPYVKYGNTAA